MHQRLEWPTLPLTAEDAASRNPAPLFPLPPPRAESLPLGRYPTDRSCPASASSDLPTAEPPREPLALVDPPPAAPRAEDAPPPAEDDDDGLYCCGRNNPPPPPPPPLLPGRLPARLLISLCVCARVCCDVCVCRGAREPPPRLLLHLSLCARRGIGRDGGKDWGKSAF